MAKSTLISYSLYNPTKTLSSVYKRRAEKELNECPDQVSAHLESLRRWLKSMPHLTCPMDDAFLLAFLRQAKYNHMKAQHRLDNFCTFRTSPIEGRPSWFEDTPKRRAIWYKLLEMKNWAPLGFTKEGTLVQMVKAKNLNMDEVSMEELSGSIQLWNDTCLADARIQITGFAMILDLSEMPKENIFKMFDQKTSKYSTKYFQECLPFRINKLIYYNVPKIFETLFDLYSKWLNKKIRSRVMLLGSDMTPAFNALPGLKELIPESYGGDRKISYEGICEENEPLMKSLPDCCPEFKIAVDESKRPIECKNGFRMYEDLPVDMMGKSGTFVKLNKDEI